MKKILIIIISIFLLFSCWENKLEEKIDIETKKEYKILALWDSLTAWYNLDISESYPAQLENILIENWYNYEVINAWVSWDTSKNLLSRINLYNEKYDIVLLNIWWNDWLRSLNLDDLKLNIQKIIDIFSESKIVLFSIDMPVNYWDKYRKQLKEVYKELSEENEIYFYWLFFKGIDYNTHFLWDRIHPNKKWYEIISKNIYSYLLKNNLIKND